MSTAYVVCIRLKSKELRYVRVHGWEYPRFSLVRTKAQASRFSQRVVAELVSGYFWEHRWDQAEYDCRMIKEIRTRGPDIPKKEKPYEGSEVQRRAGGENRRARRL
jgi:hypothetical protein